MRPFLSSKAAAMFLTVAAFLAVAATGSVAAPPDTSGSYTVFVLDECQSLKYGSCLTNTTCDIAVHGWFPKANETQKKPPACTMFPCKGGDACVIPAGCNSVYDDPTDCVEPG